MGPKHSGRSGRCRFQTGVTRGVTSGGRDRDPRAGEYQRYSVESGAVASAKGKLKGEKRIRLEEHPGRELIIESDASGGVRLRMYAVGKRLYQVMAAGSRAFLQAKETGQFLDSFQLVR